MANNTIVFQCNCKNSFQDQEYGKSRRLHNLMGPKKDKARCTVCKNVVVVYNSK